MCSSRYNRRQILKNSSTFALASWSASYLPRALAQEVKGVKDPLILHLHCDGGWDQSLIFDPKLDSPFVDKEDGASVVKVSETFSFGDHPSRLNVKAFFNEYSSVSTIINGLHCPFPRYENAIAQAFGFEGKESGSYFPWLAEWTAGLPKKNLVPVLNFGVSIPQGSKYSSVVTLSHTQLQQLQRNNLPFLHTTGDTGIQSFLLKRQQEMLASAASSNIESNRIKSTAPTRDSIYQLAAALQNARSSYAGYDSLTPPSQQAVTALQLFAKGQINAAIVKYGDDLAWDSRSNNDAAQSQLFNALFGDLRTIMLAAKNLGLWGRLIILVSSERGRHPRHSPGGGKTPWPFTSLLVVSALTRAGVVLGATDEYGRGIAIDPVFARRTESRRDTLIEMPHIMTALCSKFNILLSNNAPKVEPMTSIFAGST